MQFVTIRVIGVFIVLTACAAIPVAQVRAQTQAAMNAEARADFKRADAELNKTYEAVLKKLPDDESKQKLKQSQRAWLAFRDAEAAFAADRPRRVNGAHASLRDNDRTNSTANQTIKSALGRMKTIRQRI